VKNKKLFAILTLVCFMFTLMPVAAFAAPTYTLEATQAANGDVTLTLTSSESLGTAGDPVNYYVVADNTNGAAPAGTLTIATDTKVATKVIAVSDVAALSAAGVVYGTGAASTAPTANVTIPASVVGKAVALTTAIAKNDMSGILLVDDTKANVSKAQAQAGIEVQVYAKDKNGYSSSFAANKMVIWAEDGEGLTSALTVYKDAALANAWSENNNVKDIFFVAEEISDTDSVYVTFARPGTYTLHAGYVNDGSAVTKLSEVDEMKMSPISITVRGISVDPDTYKADVTKVNADASVADAFVAGGAADTTIGAITVTPNNVFETNVYVTLQYADGAALSGKTVAIETNSSAITVSKATDVVDAFGVIDFRVSGSIEGNYEIYVTVDGVEWVIDVQVGNTTAAYIETITEPTAPQALYDTLADDKVEFYITDINGNAVSKDGDLGMQNLQDAAPKKALYLVLTQKPAASNLTSDMLTLNNNGGGVWGLDGAQADAEGDYAVKVVLDNGSYATASWTVKKFATPVRLIVGFATNTVELGSDATAKLLYMDANGVQKDAKDVAFYANGYAVKSAGNTLNYGTVTVKSDERYVGQTIDVKAVSNKYDLVGTAQLKVVEGAVAIEVADAAADVNVNNKITWNVVDPSGNKVGLASKLYDKLGTGAVQTEIDYVILDKPEGAKVSVSDATVGKDLASKGEGKMSLTSNKVGNVTVQIILKAEYNATATDAADQQIKYYTGTAVIPVGTDATGDVVVMSIGSNQIVKNDEVATMVAAPVVKDARTFVPFRALAEAFGAEVAWDEATQAVTAELNGVKVVLTIGSADYTVNGVVNTADVAPFINGASTMVPVRFVAEAFGIKVIPTYDANGATADILFNL